MSIYKLESMETLLNNNSYPGRGIVVGKTADGIHAVAAYFIMGRSANSRNRVFVEQGDEVLIHPYDESKVEDPSLIIYAPIRRYENHIIVTNGNQTDTIYEGLGQGLTFAQALKTRCFEPDAPNLTPRISSMITLENNNFSYEMSILKSADEDGTACNRYTYDYESVKGLGHFIHTYHCDGNPIPTFQGEPTRVVIPNDIHGFTESLWNNLHEENKVSLYVRYVRLSDGKISNEMRNKNKGGMI